MIKKEMNMKKLILSIAVLAFSVSAFAQGQPRGFGIKAGVNFPKYNFSGGNNSVETDASTNFHITAFLDAPIFTDYLYVQPGISLQGKGAKGSGLVDAIDEMDPVLEDITQNTMWLEIPVNLVAKVPTGPVGHLFVGAGPYVGFGLSGKTKYDGEEIGDFEFGSDNDQKGTDFGLNFIGGYQFTNGLMIHGGYGLGLTDIAPDGIGDVKQTNRVWTVGLGFAL